MKNGVLANTISAKNLETAIRLAGVFTNDGVYTQHKPLGALKARDGYCQVKHDDVYDIFEAEETNDYRVLVTNTNGDSPIVINFDNYDQAIKAMTNINYSQKSVATPLFNIL
jgi:hypothetical protein